MRIVLKSDFGAVDEVARVVQQYLASEAGISESCLLFRTDFVLRELLNNAVEHGNHCDRHKQIILEIVASAEVLQLSATDEGTGLGPVVADVLAGACSFGDGAGDIDNGAERRRGLRTIAQLGWTLQWEGSRVTARLERSKIEKKGCGGIADAD